MVTVPPVAPFLGEQTDLFNQPGKLSLEEENRKKRNACIAKGGKWDNATFTCKMPEEEKPTDAGLPGSTVVDADTGETKGFIDSKGNFVKAGKADVELQNRKRAEQAALQEGRVTTEQIGQVQQGQKEARQLAGQVGQFGELGVSPTGLDVGEALTTGVVGAIPSALKLGITGAGIGAVGGTAAAPGIGTGVGAAFGAVAGFVGGMASSMIGNFKSQRTDTTTAQQRVLDEGKQNLNDWATLAGTDPANRGFYVANFNQQLALINQAYRQMKLDTSRDITKFETALPNLAEFETFYSAQGERDFLVARMFESLKVQQDTEYIYRMMELNERRKKE